ncbi:MAG: hypothetical protein ACOCVB_00205 [Bacillota bacterium]
MKYRIIVILSLLFIFLITGLSQAAPVMDSVHYTLSGNVSEVNALKLDLDYHLDSINDVTARFTYHEQAIKVDGAWKINFLQRQDYDIDLRLVTAAPLNDFSFNPALGIGGSSDYLEHNDLYWEVDYYFQEELEEKKWVYQVGISLPVTSRGKISLGMGNSYWYHNDNMVNLGLKVDL